MRSAEEIPFTSPRRKDRAQPEPSWIRELLQRSPLGTLATVGEDGPGLNPNLFVFDPSTDTLYLHTAKTGATRSQIEAHPRVAFCVAEMGRLLPSEAAVSFSVEYASVVLQGEAAVIEDPEEARSALELLMAKYAPHLELGRDYRGIEDKDLARTSVFRVDILSWTGKGKMSDAPDAYAYSDVAGCPGSEKKPSECPGARKITR